MAFTLQVSQEVPVTYTVENEDGSPGVVQDNLLVSTSSNPEVLAVVPGTDAFSATVVATGIAGSGQLRVEGDADTGEGIVTIVGLLDFEVIVDPNTQAVRIIITPGVPVPRTTTQPSAAVRRGPPAFRRGSRN